MANRQRQKISNSKKDDVWKRANVDYYAENTRINNNYIRGLYAAAAGELNSFEYNYLTNPFGKATKDKPQLRNYPAQLRNYPLIPYLFNLLLGEKRKRPLIYTVLVRNSDSINKKKIAEIQLLKTSIEQLYINELNALGIDTGVENRPVHPLEKLMGDFSENWNDERAIEGQEILDYIVDEIDIPERFTKGFEDWLVVATIYTYKDVINEDIAYKICRPENIGYFCDTNTEMIENGEAASYREEITVSACIDRFYDLIEKEEPELLNYLDDVNGGASPSAERQIYYNDTDLGINSGYQYDDVIVGKQDLQNSLNRTVEVIHVNWKSWVEIAQLTYYTDLGEEITIEVPLDYEPNTFLGEVVHKYWVNEVWEGYRIDNKHYLGIAPIPHQRGTINNPSKCKLLYNGRVKRVGTIKCLSFVQLLMPFQHLYNFGHYKLNNTIGKNKDKFTILPMGLLNEDAGFGMIENMYYVDATGFLIVDESNDQTKQALQHIRVIDTGLNDYIKFMMEYLREIKAEAEELVGINRQRKGETSASEGLGVSENAIYTSSLMTEDLFAQYDKFQEVELNGLLDLSQYAYINGKKASYVSSDNRIKFINVNPNNHISSEYGVRVSSSSKEMQKIKKMQQYGETLASQQAKPSLLADIIDADHSFAKLKVKLQQSEVLEQQLDDQRLKQEQDSNERIAQLQSDDKNNELEFKYYQVDSNNSTSRLNTIDTIQAKVTDTDVDNNGVNDYVQLQEVQLKHLERMDNLSIERTKTALELEKLNEQKQQRISDEKMHKEKLKTDIQKAKITKKNTPKKK